MLNIYYIYSVIWSVTLLLYSLGWSDLCKPLQMEIRLFFLMTIGISLFLGYTFRESFTLERIPKFPRRNRVVTAFLVSACMLEYIYCGQIPLIAIISGASDYTSFTGISTVHTILNTFAVFYAQYLFYLYACFPEKKSILIEYLSIIFVAFFLQFNRGQILINACISVVLYFATRKSIKKRTLFIIGIGVIAALFLFGALGNLRVGSAWNDTSYFEELGKFNESYPSWLPKQFMWSYIYITSPLANLNYNAINYGDEIRLIQLLFSFVPDFISRRLIDLDQPLLAVSYFNVTSAFGELYIRGGLTGMIMYWFALLFGQNLLLRIASIKISYKAAMNGIMCAIVAFSFFTNTIAYSAISFAIVYPLLTMILDRIKITR